MDSAIKHRNQKPKFREKKSNGSNLDELELDETN